MDNRRIENLGNVGFLIKGEPIERLCIIELYFWNNRKEPIRKEDVASGVDIVFEQPFTIYHAAIDTVVDKTNNFSIAITGESGNTAHLSFDYLKRKEGAKVILYTNAEDFSDAKVSYRIIGASKPTQRLSKVTSQKILAWRLFLESLKAIFYSSTAITVYNFSWYSLGDWHDVGLLFRIAILSLVLLLIAAIVNRYVMRVYNYYDYIPKQLRSKEHERMPTEHPKNMVDRNT